MPDAPNYVPAGDRARWTAIWKNALAKYGNEGRAYQVANGAVLHGKSLSRLVSGVITRSVIKAYRRRRV